jgi:hypothetical protein
VGLEEGRFSIDRSYGRFCSSAYGTIANTLAKNLEPPFGFGNVTTAIAPASGTWSRFARYGVMARKMFRTGSPGT